MRTVLEAWLRGARAWQEAVLVFINRLCDGDEEDADYLLDFWLREAKPRRLQS